MFEKYLTKTGRLSITQPQEIRNQWYTLKFQEVHGDTYDYSDVEYLTISAKVQINCKYHGIFLQRPNDHLNGQGCPKCCNASKTKTTEQCIKDFTLVHGCTYDYSKVQYTHNSTKVEIICKEHGSFLQQPRTHLEGKGCPKCQVSNQDTLYLLRCKDTTLVKIGVTNNLEKRVSAIGGNLVYIHHITLEKPRELERLLHKKYQEHSRFNPNVRSGGTEFFDLSDQQVQEIMEILDNVGTTTS